MGYTGITPIASFKDMSDQSPWKKTEYEITGIPEDWTEWYRKSVSFQWRQWIYQNYKSRGISEEKVSSLMKRWELDTIAGQFCSLPITCETTFIFRKLEDGNVEYIVDTDGDHNFSDEKLYISFPNLKYNQMDSSLPHTPWVHYEMYLNREIVRDSVPFIVEKGHFDNMDDYITYAMPVYAESISGADSLIVNAMSPDFLYSKISLRKDLDPASERFLGQKTEEGSRIKLKNGWYTFVGFDRASKEIILTKVDVTTDTIYPSVGFYAPDFNLKELGTEQELRLADYKGKYVLLDFWGTWCKGCVQALPGMVKMKENLKNFNFEIVSVACFSNMENYKELKAKYGMNWLHTWQMTKDGVIADYAVENYPSMFLIDPKGKIVGYNLSMEEVKGIVKNQN